MISSSNAQLISQKHIFFMLIAVALLAACGNSPQMDIENAIRSQLKDPTSAVFKDLRISKGGRYACVSWNARNGFGGYGDWSTARLRLRESGWGIKEIETPKDMLHWCDQDALNVDESIEYDLPKLGR